MTTQSTAQRKVVLFLVLATALAAFPYYRIISAGTLGVDGGRWVFALMWAPGIAGILTRLLTQRSLRGTGWGPGKPRYLAYAYLLPLVVGLPVYGAVWLTGLGGLSADGVQASAGRVLGTDAASLPVALLVLATVGVAMSLLSAAGEEIGWRGVLVPELAKATTPTSTALISGVIWFAYHLPIILLADYGSGAPLAYVTVMFGVMVVAISFLLTWMRLSSGSVWSAVLFHGAHNLFIQAVFDRLTTDRGPTEYLTTEFGAGLAVAYTIVAVLVWRRAAPTEAPAPAEPSQAPEPARALSATAPLLLAALLAPLAATSLHAQTPAVAAATPAAPAAATRGPSDPAEVEAFLDGLMAAQMKEEDVAGAVVAVVRDGEVLLVKGYGEADVEAGKPVDPARTLFRIGSISKLFTWTAVMQLVEQGKLDLDADVNSYLDFEVPATFEEPITLRHLLTHTPGFEERGIGLFSTSTQPRGEWLEENMPARVRAPGTFSAYSNYGTALAGYIVERVSGLTWDEYLERNIYQPLGLENTTGRQPLPERLAGQMSVGYADEGSRLVAKDFETLIPVAPAGSISASGTDMARFMIAHLQNGRYGDARILADSTARWMHGRTFGHDDRINGFALGFYEKSANGVRVIGHGGDTQWFHSDLALVPEDGVGVFVSYNTASGGGLTGPFTELFLEHYYGDTAPPALAVLDSVPLEPYLGTYRSTRSNYTTVERLLGLLSPVRVEQDAEHGELLVSMGGEAGRYVPVGEGLFREADGSGLLAFRAVDGGRADHFFLGQAPMMAMERVEWYESPRLHLVILGIAAVLFLSALVLIPARYALQRRFAEVPRLQGRERAARWLAVAVALLNLAGIIGLGVVMSDMSAVLNGDLAGLPFVLTFFVLAAVLTLGLVWFTVTAWRTGMWGRWGRVHYTAVTLSAIAVVLVFNYWNLLGWHLS